jgi:succinylglutamate desuccinylase
VPDAVRALAEADFGAVAQRFRDAGFVGRAACEGHPDGEGATARDPARARAAVGRRARRRDRADRNGRARARRLSRAPAALAVDLMLCVGNIDAIAAGKRFIDADLNRMFRLIAARWPAPRKRRGPTT